MFIKGNIPWNRGISRTQGEKEHIRSGISPEERKRRSERMKIRWGEGEFLHFIGEGNPSKTSEASRKISLANKNRVVKEETRNKIRMSKIGKPGPVISEENKRKHSERMKKDNPMFREEVLKKHPVFNEGPYFVSKGELFLKELFIHLGFSFIHQKRIPKNKLGFYVVDFYFPDSNKVIEFDGHSNHFLYPEKDRIRDNFLKKAHDIEILRLLPKDLNNRNRPILLKKIGGFLDEKDPN